MSAAAEKWRQVPGFEGFYEVSDRGTVRSVDRSVHLANGSTRSYRGRVLSQARIKRTGHMSVKLAKNGGLTTFRVHVLVALAFIGPRPAGLFVCHRNGRGSDNRVENLRYGTPSDNSNDSVWHGTHKHSGRATCLRHHILEQPNLVRSDLARGWRRCRACGQASSWIAWVTSKGGIPPTFEEEADSRYRKIMSGATAA